MLKLNETPGQDNKFWPDVSRIFAGMDPNWYGLGIFNLLMQLLMLVLCIIQGVFFHKTWMNMDLRKRQATKSSIRDWIRMAGTLTSLN